MKFSNKPHFEYLQYLVFLSFMFYLVIVLMNLLNAMAVADASELRRDAEMEMLYTMLQTIAFWEKITDGPHIKLKLICSPLWKVVDIRVVPDCGKVHFHVTPLTGPEITGNIFWKGIKFLTRYFIENKQRALNPKLPVNRIIAQ